ncbi:MAG: hypothetical protein AAF633_27420, partial [Chloroflexota bacterium]
APLFDTDDSGRGRRFDDLKPGNYYLYADIQRDTIGYSDGYFSAGNNGFEGTLQPELNQATLFTLGEGERVTATVDLNLANNGGTIIASLPIEDLPYLDDVINVTGPTKLQYADFPPDYEMAVDENGRATLSNLPAGRYRLTPKLVRAPYVFIPPYLVDPIYVDVVAEETVEVDIDIETPKPAEVNVEFEAGLPTYTSARFTYFRGRALDHCSPPDIDWKFFYPNSAWISDTVAIEEFYSGNYLLEMSFPSLRSDGFQYVDQDILFTFQSDSSNEIDITLKKKGELFGSVFNITSNTIQTGSQVILYQRNFFGNIAVLADVTTSNNGTYRFSGLEAGDYWLAIEPIEESNHNAFVFPDAPRVEDARPIRLEHNEQRQIDFSVESGAQIEGEVFEKYGLRLPDNGDDTLQAVEVALIKETNTGERVIQTVKTRDSFTFSGVQPGTYYLQYGGDYVTGYDRQYSGDTQIKSEAKRFIVTDAGIYRDERINILQGEASINVWTDFSDPVFQFAQIELLDATSGEIIATTFIKSNPNYSALPAQFFNVPEGVYRIRVRPTAYFDDTNTECREDRQLFPLYYQGDQIISSWAAVEPLEVRANSAPASMGISFSDQAPQNESYLIQGQILDSGAGPLANVNLSLNGALVTATDSQGTFSIIAPSGNHLLQPALENYSFQPENISLSVIDSDVTDVDFIGFLQDDPAPTGTPISTAQPTPIPSQTPTQTP